jgi:hypothetical protein
MLLKLFLRSGFFNFGNKSKSGGLIPPDVEVTFIATFIKEFI